MSLQHEVNGQAHTHTHSYLGAMNTCPTVSKELGNKDSKSAIKRNIIWELLARGRSTVSDTLSSAQERRRNYAIRKK